MESLLPQASKSYTTEGYKLSGTISPLLVISPFLDSLFLTTIISMEKFHKSWVVCLDYMSFISRIIHTLSCEFSINVTRCSNLEILAIGGNNLIGKIPMQIGSLQKLRGLFLLFNNLSGEISTSLWNLTSLSIVSLDYNNLEGSIPEEIEWLRKLTSFEVGINKLKGVVIPFALYNLSSLVDIILLENQLNGSLPTNMFSNETSLIYNSKNLEKINCQITFPQPLQMRLSLK